MSEEVYTFCNKCYKFNKTRKYEIRETKTGKQIPVFRCSSCNGSTTEYEKKFVNVHRLMKVFVVCKYCGYLWKRKSYGMQSNTIIQCPNCNKRNQFEKSRNMFWGIFWKNPEQAIKKIIQLYPKMEKNIYFALLLQIKRRV